MPWSCGYARYTDLVVRRAGIYTIQFQSIIRDINFWVETANFTVNRGSVHHLGMALQPAGFRPIFAFKVQPVVLLLDIAENIIDGEGPESQISITASLTPDSPKIYLAPANRLVRVAQSGVAKFRDLYLPPAGIGKNVTMLFSAGILLLPTTSTMFVVAEVAHTLIVTNAPTFGLVVEPFPRQPKVEVQDRYGNLCTWYEDTGAKTDDGVASEGIVVVAELLPPPGLSAAMLGEKSKLVVDGKVDFTDLNVDKPGIGYTIRFKATRGIVDPNAVQTITIKPFNVSYGYPYRLVFDFKPGSETEIQDPRGATPGVPMAQQPRIMVQDRVGNLVGDERGILQITATLLQRGKPAVNPLKGFSVLNSCLYKAAGTGQCGCLKGPVTGCGVASWPVTQNGIRIDTVGNNYTLIFTATFREPYMWKDSESGIFNPKIREIALVPVTSLTFDVAYGAVDSLKILEQPWGFVLNEPFLGQPVIGVYDKAGNFVPTNEVEIQSHFAVVDPDGGSRCCFDQSYTKFTVQGTAYFQGVKLLKIPVEGNILRLKFSSGLIDGYIFSESFLMADSPVKIKVTRQPTRHLPGIGFTVLPQVSLLDRNDTVAGWYKDKPMEVKATLCIEIPCVTGIFVGALKTATPCFKCTDYEPTFCDVQTQTPILLKLRTIQTQEQMIRGEMSSVAYNGVSTFTNLVLYTIGTYKFKFSTPGYASIESDPFTIFHGVADHLHLQAQPESAIAGFALSQQPVVVIRDAGYNVVTSDLTTIITASLVNNKNISGAKLVLANDNIMGPFVRVTHGTLYWQLLQVDVAGSYEILFTSSLGANCTPVTSQTFEILCGPPVKLNVVKAPDLCVRGRVCEVQPIVEVQDLQSNKVPVTQGFNISISAISCTWTKDLMEASVIDGSLQMTGIGVFSDALWHAGCDGRYQLTVAAHGLQTATSEIFQVSDLETNTTVAISVNPGFAGFDFRQQPVVELTDKEGRRVRGADSSMTVKLLKCESGGPCKPHTLAPVIGTQTVNNTYGQSDFTNLRVDMAGTCYRFLFTAPGMTAGISSLFDVKVGTIVNVLQIKRHPLPKGAIAGKPFPAQPVVAALDAGKNVILFQNSLQITATLLVDAQISLRELKGDRTALVDNGVATFTDMFTEIRGACFKLSFDVYGKTSLSETFYVGPAAPYKLHLAVQPSGPHVGWSFNVQPVIYFHDYFGNVVHHKDCEEKCHLLNTMVNVTLLPDTIPNPSRVLQGTKMITFQIDSLFGTRASFTNLRIDRAGSYALHFTSGSGLLMGVISQGIVVVPAEDRANHLDVLVQPYGIRTWSQATPIPFIIQPVVAIFDLGNNIIKSADTNVTVKMLGGYVCGTTQYPDQFKCGPWVLDHVECGSRDNCKRTSGLELLGTKIIETVNGIATFTDLWIKGSPTRFVQLEFTSDDRCTPSDSACIPTKSYVFDIAGAVTYLSLMDQPSKHVVAGEQFAIQPRLGIFDASGRRHTWAPPGTFQAMNVSSYQMVSTWCNSSQTLEELAGTGYDCNIKRTNTSALNISQYGVWDRLEGNRTNIEFLDSFVNFTDLRFDRVARSRSGYHLSFSFKALTGEFFTLDWCCVQVAPAKPDYLEVLSHPSGPRVGEAFSLQAHLLIRDRFGNLVTGEFGDVTAKLYQNDRPAPEGSVERVFGSNVASARRGVVRFQNLGYNQSGENFTVAFIFPGVKVAFSNQFEIAPGKMIAYLYIERHPNGFEQSGVFAVQPIIETHDLGGNRIALNATGIYSPMIQATLVNSTSGVPYPGAELFGQTVVNASDGSAIFHNLGISRSGTDMRLRFTLANSTVRTYFSATIYRTVPPANENLSATVVPNGTISHVSVYSVYIESTPFQVANKETHLIFSNTLSTASSGGTVFKSQPIVHLKDENSFLVSAHEDMVVSAELWMYGSPESRCPAARLWKCGIVSGVQRTYDTACTLSEADCPKLEGTTTQVLQHGVAAFSDLYINGCNDLTKDSCYKTKYRIRFTTTSSRGTFTLDTLPINITVGEPIGAFLHRQPVPGVAGEKLVAQPVVWIVDAGKNRVTTWSQNASASLVQGRITICCDKCTCPAWSGQTEVSPKSGAFDFDFKIDTAGEDYKFSFTSGLFTLESNLFTVNVGQATHLRITRQPRLYGGSFFETQPRLEVLDKGLNVVQNHSGAIKAELIPNEFGAKLTGDNTVTVRKGEAFFVNLAINKEGSCYVIRFTSGSLKSIDTIPMTVDIGLPAGIKFVKAPSGFRPGYAWDTQPIVAIVDAGDNVVPIAQDMIEVLLYDQNQVQQPLCSFSLMGAPVCETAVKAVQGIATFSGLRIDTSGKGYTLVFGKERGGYTPVVSPTFDVTVGAEFQLFVERHPRVSTLPRGQPGYLFPTQPIVSILDAGGNLVPTTSRRIEGELYRLNQPASDTKPELWQVQMQMWSPAYKLQSIINRVVGRSSFEGKAYYSELRIDVAAADYIIRFRSDNMLSVDSGIFSVDLGAPYTTKIHRQPAGLRSGKPFNLQPVVHIVDRGLNTLHDANPLYRMIAAIESGEGLMYPFPAEYGIIPIVDGVSQFSMLTVTGRGEHSIKFSAFNLQTDTTMVFNVSGPSHAVSIKTQPIGSVAAAVMTLQPQTYIRDDIAIIVDTDSSSRVTANIVPESNPNNAKLSGTLTVDCCWGQCKFTDLVISKSGQIYQLAFSSAGLNTDISHKFEVGGPAKLIVNTQPAAAVSDLPIGNQPVIHVTDMKSATQDYCNLDHCDIGGPAEVTASIKPETGGLELCSLAGNNVATVANGVATFTNLQINGAGRSFRERDYILVFTAIDLYQIESQPFTLGYTPRPPTNYVQAAVQMTRYSVLTFTSKEQTLFVNTIAKYLGVNNNDVELVTIKDVIIKFRVEIRRTLPNSRVEVPNSPISAPPSLPPSATRNLASAPPGQALLRNNAEDPEILYYDSELGGAQRRREELGIDIRFRVFSNNTKDLFRLKEDLTALLKREGALAEKLNDEGLANLKAIMTEAPEAYKPSGGLLPPLVENNPAGAIAGSLVGAFLLFSCTVGCYTMWWRARKRALIRSENDVDTMNLLYALGIEDPKEVVEAAMPWTAEKMLEGSTEKVTIVGKEGFGDA